MSTNNKGGTAARSKDLVAVFSSPGVAEGLRRAAPGGYGAAARFWDCAFSAPALTPRMKELILLAMHASATSLNGEGVRRHVGRALAAGATEQDILDLFLTIVGVANHALYFSVPVLMRELEAAGHPDAEVPPASAEGQAIKEEFIRARGFWNEQRDVILRMMPEYFVALSDISTESWKNGSLTHKERELLCIGIDCTVTHTFEPGLALHIRNALNKGATRAEILEVFHLASLMGLESYILGAEALFGSKPE